MRPETPPPVAVGRVHERLEPRSAWPVELFVTYEMPPAQRLFERPRTAERAAVQAAEGADAVAREGEAYPRGHGEILAALP